MDWLTILLQSKAAKIGTVAVGSSSVFALLVSMINENESKIMQVVDLKNNVIMTRIDSLDKGQKDIKEMLKEIRQNVYNLNSNKNKDGK